MRNSKSRSRQAAYHPVLLSEGLSQWWFIVAVSAVGWLGLSGCSIVSPFPANQLPDKTASLVAGQRDEIAIRQSLGNPLLTSRYWGFELYRDAASQTEMPMALVIPIGLIKDDIHRYTLVSFGADQTVQSVATGLHRLPSAFRIASPIENDHLTLSLQAGPITCIREWDDRHLTLLASPSLRDHYLDTATKSADCTVVIGCGTRRCSSKLTIDNGSILPLPCRLNMANFDPTAMELLRQGKQEEYTKRWLTEQLDTVAAIRLAPGSHILNASGGRWQQGLLTGLFGRTQSITLSCGAGEILYLVIDVSARDFDGWGAKDVVWKMDLYKIMPEFFVDRPLVLYRGDQWLVNPEPAD